MMFCTRQARFSLQIFCNACTCRSLPHCMGGRSARPGLFPYERKNASEVFSRGLVRVIANVVQSSHGLPTAWPVFTTLRSLRASNMRAHIPEPGQSLNFAGNQLRASSNAQTRGLAVSAQRKGIPDLHTWTPVFASACAACILTASPALSAMRDKLPPPSNDPGRCSLEALDKFAETRAVFSQEASSGMDEAFVDVRGCDYSNMNLTSKVFSGVLMRGANFANSNFVGVEFARADAKSANFENADFTDVNGYSATFDGANLENAQFENAILTGATFGKDKSTGEWANLKGAHFEGALLSVSDVGRICENPTLDTKTKKFELGCRVSKT